MATSSAGRQTWVPDASRVSIARMLLPNCAASLCGSGLSWDTRRVYAMHEQAWSCDHCHKEVKTLIDEHRPPENWYGLDHYARDGEHLATREWTFCSRNCVLHFLWGEKRDEGGPGQ
jgi:hypothetical protein